MSFLDAIEKAKAAAEAEKVRDEGGQQAQADGQQIGKRRSMFELF